MQIHNLPAICARKPAWNKGRIVGQKRPLMPKHVWAIRVRLEIAEMSGTSRCSMLASTASCEDAIWSNSRSQTFSLRAK